MSDQMSPSRRTLQILAAFMSDPSRDNVWRRLWGEIGWATPTARASRRTTRRASQTSRAAPAASTKSSAAGSSGARSTIRSSTAIAVRGGSTHALAVPALANHADHPVVLDDVEVRRRDSERLGHPQPVDQQQADQGVIPRAGLGRHLE